MRKFFVLLISLFFLLSFINPAQAATKQVLVVGDSIPSGSSNYIDFYMDQGAAANTTIKAIGGTAICDILVGNGGPWTINRLLAERRYDAVVVAYSGNSLTNCMGGRTGQAVVDKYRADANALMEVTRQAGVPLVVWVQPPAAAKADLDYVRSGIVSVYGQMRSTWPTAQAIDGGIGLELFDRFATSLPCASWEKTTGQGCYEGSIRIGDFDGVHPYCRQRGPSYYGIVAPCDTYSAGGNRYGMNLAKTRSLMGI